MAPNQAVVDLLTATYNFDETRIEPFVVACWAVFIPLALVNIFVSGALLL